MGKDMNWFEHDYIIEALEHFAFDVKRGSADIDKHACILTAFMQGQLVKATNRNREIANECEALNTANIAKISKIKRLTGALDRIADPEDNANSRWIALEALRAESI